MIASCELPLTLGGTPAGALDAAPTLHFLPPLPPLLLDR